MRSAVTTTEADVDELLLETPVRPGAAIGEHLRSLWVLRHRVAPIAPPLAPALLTAVPVFLYPTFGGAGDVALVVMAAAAVWLVSATAALLVGRGSGLEARHELHAQAALAGSALVLGMVIGLTLGHGVPALLALLLALEVARATRAPRSLTLDLALGAFAMVTRLDVGMSALGVEHGPMPTLLVLVLTVFEGLIAHRASRAAVVQTAIGPAVAPGLATLDLLLTALATVSTALFVILLTQEPLIRGLAGGAALLAVPGFVLALSCRLLSVWRTTGRELPSLLHDHGALIGLIATALGLTIGGELMGL